MIDWILDRAFLFFIIGVIALCFGAGYLVARSEAKACDKLMSFAQTHRDSLDVMLKCDAPSDAPTTIVMPVYTR